MRIAVKIAYDGRNFHGYARQPSLRTVEGDVIKNLEKNNMINSARDASFRSASRTDKGVSALCNVISFEIRKKNDSMLDIISNDDKSIIAYGIKEVDNDFYPRFAKMRWYSYYLKKNNFNIDLMLSTAALFTGTHNFSNFARIEEHRDPVRTVDNIVIKEKNEFFIIDFFSQTFLWHQIRRIISAIVNVQKGKYTNEQIKHGLEDPNEKRDFGIAPAEPLILMDIDYGFEFEKNQKIKEVEEIEKLIFFSIKNFYSKKN